MDGVHDLGGMDGFGPIERDEAVFHADWERRAFGIAMTVRVPGNSDDFRHAIERIDPALYLTAGYFGRWLAAAEVRVRERGLVSSADVDARARPGAAPAPRAVASPGLPTRSQEGGPNRTVDRPRRFSVGQAVRAADAHPSGHTRLPRYIRGRRGVVVVCHPAFVFPDTNAHGLGEQPCYAYSVRFEGHELWGGRAEPGAAVHVDVFEPHLEPL